MRCPPLPNPTVSILFFAPAQYENEASKGLALIFVVFFQCLPRDDHTYKAADHERDKAHRAKSAYQCAGHVSQEAAFICS